MRTPIVAVALMLLSLPADAQPTPGSSALDLYQAGTIVTGTDLRSRPAGFAACLADVLAKVSGDAALLDDARVARLHPEMLVAGFDYVDRMSGLPHRDEQGSSDRPFTLTVRFDHAAVDATLRDLGAPAYVGPRPVVVPLVVVDAPAASFVLTADTPLGVDHRAALAAGAERVGVALHLPGTPELVAGREDDGLPLLGTLTWSDAARGWVADWQAEWHGHGHRWGAAGVSFDEAYRIGLRGALGLVAGHPPP